MKRFIALLRALAGKRVPGAEAGSAVPLGGETGGVNVFSKLRAKAESGDAAAQLQLGIIYAKRDGGPKDGFEAEAVKWFRRAADRGLADAQFNLGWMYDRGEGVAKGHAEAVRWFRKAAEQGLATAQCEVLAECMKAAKGAATGHAEAVSWYRKAAEQGLVAGQRNLGSMYGNGQGVLRDSAEAVKWFRLAADQSDADAQGSLGFMYANGQGVPQDSAEAAMWFRRAATAIPMLKLSLASCMPKATACQKTVLRQKNGYAKQPNKKTFAPRAASASYLRTATECQEMRSRGLLGSRLRPHQAMTNGLTSVDQWNSVSGAR